MIPSTPKKSAQKRLFSELVESDSRKDEDNVIDGGVHPRKLQKLTANNESKVTLPVIPTFHFGNQPNAYSTPPSSPPPCVLDCYNNDNNNNNTYWIPPPTPSPSRFSSRIQNGHQSPHQRRGSAPPNLDHYPGSSTSQDSGLLIPASPYFNPFSPIKPPPSRTLFNPATNNLTTLNLNLKPAMKMFPQNPPQLFSRYRSDFSYEGLIGSGSYSDVYKSRHRLDGCLYAIKKTKSAFKSTHQLTYFLKEVWALSVLSTHPNLVRYHNSWIENSYLFIQMEFCNSGSLFCFLSTLSTNSLLPPSFSWCNSQILKCTKQILNGLSWIHSQNCLHLDLKPENILVNITPHNKIYYKIADLGLIGLRTKSMIHHNHSNLTPGEEGEDTSNNNNNLESHMDEALEEMLEENKSEIGDGRYVAPEVLERVMNKGEGEKGEVGTWSDVYSAGKTIKWIMAMGEGWKKDEKEEELSKGMAEIVQGMVEEDWRKRSSLKEVLKRDEMKGEKEREVARLTRELEEEKRKGKRMSSNLETVVWGLEVLKKKMGDSEKKGEE
eukprot:TRINITY_DN5834_c0_g2_i1.p1 TRINITY_DN5834_c0_g2~~TRINITY_DN5834_c0_g2_i1.p1  ORF type:complete len:549 (+),score=133.90 TRINITY_DN5834_c0_g2_i1:272-1918(+)